MLDWQAESFSRQDPPISDGATSSPSSPTSRRLLAAQLIQKWLSRNSLAFSDLSSLAATAARVAPMDAELLSGLLDALSTKRLNQKFAEWLMGWEVNWTSTEPTACGASATASWRLRLRRHLSSLCGG